MSNYALSKHKKSDTIKWIIIFALVALLAAGFAGMAIVLNRQVKTKELTALSYEIGTLDETGAETDGNTSIRTKDYVTVNGLSVTITDNATVTYQLYFYDTDKAFIESTQELVTDYSGSVPETAEYVKVLITPIADEDGVTFTEIAGYASQLTVTVNR